MSNQNMSNTNPAPDTERMTPEEYEQHLTRTVGEWLIPRGSRLTSNRSLLLNHLERWEWTRERIAPDERHSFSVPEGRDALFIRYTPSTGGGPVTLFVPEPDVESPTYFFWGNAWAVPHLLRSGQWYVGRSKRSWRAQRMYRDRVEDLSPRSELVARWVRCWELLPYRDCLNLCDWQQDALNGEGWEWSEDRGEWLPEGDWVYLNADRANGVSEGVYHVDDTVCCDDCSATVHQRASYSLPSGGAICYTCYCDNYATCSHCGDVEPVGDLTWPDDGECYCSNCAPEPSGRVSEYHAISRPALPSRGHLWVSGELEMESEDRDGIAREVHDYDYRIICEKDGSLSGSKGIEIIISNNAGFGELLEALEIIAGIGKRHRAKAWDLGEEKAGFHLSINGNALTPFERGRLWFAFYSNKTLLCDIAGRECERWASFERPRLDTFKHAGSGDKYQALAARPNGRLEFRLFRASLNVKRLKLYCDAVEALVKIARDKTIPVHQLYEASYSALGSLLVAFKHNQ